MRYRVRMLIEQLSIHTSRNINYNVKDGTTGRIYEPFILAVELGIKLSRYSYSVRAGLSGDPIPVAARFSTTVQGRPWGSTSLL